MKIVRGADEVRRLLTRASQEEGPPPPHLADGIRRIFGEPLTVGEAVERIIADVRSGGDAALADYAQRIDGAAPSSWRVPPEEIERAYRETPPDLLDALTLAAERVRAFHERAMPESWYDGETGLGQRFIPVASVGVYVPGGTAAYPSTVLHTAVPAKTAGVERVVVATPPRGGAVAGSVLAAAHIAGVDEVYQVGGAQAIAALAYGTESVPRVDTICGPGNIFVTEAKRRVYGVVGLDGLHGPTETLIVADASARPEAAAADLLAQAEHDVLATPVLLTDSAELAEAVSRQVAEQLADLERAEIAAAALEGQGFIGVVDSIDEAIDLANEFAPEHLCLLVADPSAALERVRNAGGVFVGGDSAEALGDYVAGPSHVMPTGGTARFASALGVHDFLRTSERGRHRRGRRRAGRGGGEDRARRGLHRARPRRRAATPSGIGEAMTFGFDRLLRPHLRGMKGYVPIMTPGTLESDGTRPDGSVVKLDGNENVYGCSPKAAEAVANLTEHHIYPDPEQRRLRAALAEYTGVDARHILAGSGSDELDRASAAAHRGARRQRRDVRADLRRLHLGRGGRRRRAHRRTPRR